MILPLPDLTQIAEAAIREHDSSLISLGIASSDGESGRVELLVRVGGCRDDPCTLSLNVSRDERERFGAELISQLKLALAGHSRRDGR